MQAVSSRVVTVPNVLSAVRLALIPLFLWLLGSAQYGWALVVIVISSLTDFVDGFIARRFNQVTRLGQVLDPAVDRLFIFSTLIGLAWQHFLPWWLVILIVLRDVGLLAMGPVLATHGYGPLPVHHLGKVATFALLFALPTLVLGAAFPAIAAYSDPAGWALALWGTFLYWWAGAIYLRETVRLVREDRVARGAGSDTLGN
ncbi:CDP-alcohol phosphatidyltransferase family protein [Homoserinibacter gongjuensis]|jgi:cardiolipin synthase|uniref:CDP-diacylglycerol--glycerol-3-phosphate 3-phosphatidyltransferase n=1 Tax=Homoserinibacter gongjuensis TaxID=1162968 RepID=A0ABQ6JWU9_9MICO|nr:CDP-alcohol phosphatidyltransferase family protein [Homoserinibacter gongjuensis]GMA92775.1 CDP-diacylglycerol--glycerol-3-phosphate 3-phosphatidyltransferase [Homoserinibacter gongjuensis]HTN58105.1 CDP-alcohol phosphatidyltransferase family protein [Protaetiibacter sp.]